MEFPITKAERSGVSPIIAFWGPSSSGKTMTALLVARGIVGPKGKIGVIDTENKRAMLHADVAMGEGGEPWLHLDLQPPFTSERFTGAGQALISEGCDIIIVDSGSHAWEGYGGTVDQAAEQPGYGISRWLKPKTDHKKMVDTFLRASIPIIWCLRSKSLTEQRRDNKSGKQIVANRGLTPISEKGLIYEMTISILLGLDHKPVFFDENSRYNAVPEIVPVKCPKDLENEIKPGQFIGVEFGQSITKWIESGKHFDKRENDLLNIARDIAYMGEGALQRHWATLSNADKKILKVHMDKELKPLATANNPKKEEPEEDLSFTKAQ